MTTTKQSWFKRSLAVLLAVMMVMSMGVANVFAAGGGSELATFEITETTADSAVLTVTRIPEPMDITTMQGVSLSGAYLVIPASEDTEKLDYNGVMDHEKAVKIGPVDSNTEFMLGYDREDGMQGIWTVSKTSTYTITGLEPDTEYVLYSAVMSVGVANSEECERITFKTDAVGSEQATFRLPKRLRIAPYLR